MVARTEMVGVGWSELPFGLGQRPRAVRNAYPQPFASAPGTSARQHSRTTVLAEAAPPQNDCWLASMPPSGPVRFTGLPGGRLERSRADPVEIREGPRDGIVDDPRQGERS